MVTEIAEIVVSRELITAFQDAVSRAVVLFRTAPGCNAMALKPVVEDAGRFLLMVEWDTIEDHIVRFRQSDAYREWRAAVGHFFAEPPKVYHLENSGLGF